MKALLLLDPDRRDDQHGFVTERAKVLFDGGERLWVEMDPALVERFAAQGIRVQPQEGIDLIELPAVVFDPSLGEPAVPPAMRDDATPYRIVQFTVPPEPEWIQALEERGASYLGDLPSRSALFAMSAEILAGAHDAAPIDWIGAYQPAYAMSHELAGQDEPFDAASLATAVPMPAWFAAMPGGALQVAFFADVDLEAARAAVQGAGAEVVGATGDALLVNCPVAALTALLRVPGVREVDIRHEPDLHNQRGGVILGTNQVRNFGNVDFLVNLDGSGEVAGIVDTGLDNGAVPTTHTDFNMTGAPASRVIRIDNLNPTAAGNAQDIEGHGTHVAGTVAGDGRTAPPPDAANPLRSVPRGMAPAARLLMTSVNNFTLPAPAVPRPLDFSRHLTAFQNHYAAGARVHSNSWGARFDNTYTSTTGSLDRYAWLHPDAVLLFSSGNAEADLNNDGRLDQGFLGPEATGKNTLVIGASENVTSLDGDGRNYQTSDFPCNRYGSLAGSAVFVAANLATPFSMSDSAQDLAIFSCRGLVRNTRRPTHRRVKPDLVAPGTNVLSTRSSAMPIAPTIGQNCPPVAAIPNPDLAASAPQASYFVISGTSMATPMVAGACLLVRQFYRQRYGQLRRPQLLEAVSDLVDVPAIALRGDRRVVAWVRRDAGAARNDIVAVACTADGARDGNPVVLASAVGDRPAPALAVRGTTTLLLWRDASGALKLAAFDAALAAIAAFGTAGVAAIAAGVRTESDLRPGFAINGDEAGIAWPAAGGADLRFQRFNAATGAAIDAQPVKLGTATATSVHPFVVHNGARWAVFWTLTAGLTNQLMLRFVAPAGALVGAAATSITTQPEALGAPHAAWDPAQQRFLVAYASDRAASRGVNVLRVDAAGAAFGVAQTVVPLAAPIAARRPRVLTHPDGGFILLWEDASAGSFDLWLSFLDPTGRPGAVHRLQISDTPDAIAGFAAIADAAGVVPAWLSSDEANLDLKGAFALGLSKYGVFIAQQDPATPLLENQFYARQTLSTSPVLDRPATAIAWSGGDFYLLRITGNALVPDLELVHTSTDGIPESGFGVNGARRIDQQFGYASLCLAWTGSRLAVGLSFGPDNRVLLRQADGQPVASFGTAGSADLKDLSADPIHLQIATQGAGAALRLFVGYGRFGANGAHTLRYTVLGPDGKPTIAGRDLAPAAGTAVQGWFHLLATEAPQHLVAAWHALDGAGSSRVFVQRYTPAGAPQAGHAAPIALSTAAGDAMNATLAPRAVQFQPGFPTSATDLRDSRRREFGAAWQQKNAAGRWEIWFSRLDRQGVPSPTAGQFDVAVVTSATDSATEPQLVWHGDGYGLAWLQQSAGGASVHVLMFAVLDPLGRRPDLAASGPVALAPDFTVTGTADVLRFHLIWTGASFRVTWTESDGAQLLHRVRGIAVPRAASSARYDAPFQQPSAALVRATLINGATNLANTALPNHGSGVNDGYGWGRVNLRQTLAPAQPVTFQVRDDASVAAGRRVRYDLRLRRGTRLLRITLVWADPPGDDIVNHLHLRVTTPPFTVGGVRVLHGNRYDPAPGRQHLSLAVPTPEPVFEDTHTIQQVVLAAPPDLPDGIYQVEVICTALNGGAFQPFDGQPFALVLVGSGDELRTAATAAAAGVKVY